MMADNDSKESVDQILHDSFKKIKLLQRAKKNSEKEHGTSTSDEWKSLIEKTINTIDNMMTGEESLTMIRLMAMKTTLLFESAKMISFNNEETAIKLLFQCLNNIKPHFTSPFVIYLAMKIMNHYAYLHIKYEKYEEVVVSLELAEKIYKEFCCGNLNLYFTSEDLFSPFFIIPPKKAGRLENIVTKNYEMLVYAYSKQMHDKFPECYHNVLNRHYKIPNNDHSKWSANAINLALYLLRENRFEEARHHFSAAVHMLYEYEKILKAESNSLMNVHRWKALRRTYADLAIGWVKYGLHIFTESKNKFLEQICNVNQSESIDINRKQQQKSFHLSPDIWPSHSNNDSRKVNVSSNEKLFFKTLDVSHLESQVPANFITDTSEARILFHHTHAWLKKLKVELKIQEHPMKYMTAIIDLNNLYKLLAFYEGSLEAEYAVAKLRVGTIETLRQIFHEIRPQCWVVAEPLLLQELAAIHLDLLALNVRRLYAIYDTSPDANSTEFDEIVQTISNLQYKLQSDQYAR